MLNRADTFPDSDLVLWFIMTYLFASFLKDSIQMLGKLIFVPPTRHFCPSHNRCLLPYLNPVYLHREGNLLGIFWEKIVGSLHIRFCLFWLWFCQSFYDQIQVKSDSVGGKTYLCQGRGRLIK